MKAVGVICEYNPFHLGHRFQLEEIRKRVGEDCVILCCMSGHFVQRGEPAVFAPALRAKAAIENGADLVVELPLPWAMAPAQRFARGGVSLLKECGCDMIAFGTECEDPSLLKKAAELLAEPKTEELLHGMMQQGDSYAAAREKALNLAIGSESRLLQSPNNILAVEYMQAMAALQAPMEMLAVPRKGPEHGSLQPVGNLASAGAIREKISKGQEYALYLPETEAAELRKATEEGKGPVSLYDLEPMILYRLRTMEAEEYKALPDDSEGLSNRLMRYGKTAATLEEVLQQTKTKRYPMSRIKRMTVSALLGLTKENTEGLPPYIRVLASNEKGRKYLRSRRGLWEKPVFMRPAAARKEHEDCQKIMLLEAQAADIYGLAQKNPAPGGDFWRQTAWIC